jgi:prolycopene isomerase
MPSKVEPQHEIDVTLPANIKALKKTLGAHYPAESDNIEAYLTLSEKLSLECFMMLPRAQKMADQTVLESTCPHYLQYDFTPSKEVLDEFFSNPDLKAVIAAYWCYIGLPPKDIPFCDLAVMIYAYAAFKPSHVQGGSQAISSALLESFLNAGGQVLFNTGAAKIITEHEKIKAVQTEHGDIFSCDYVISNTSPQHTFNELLDIPTPKQAADDMKSRRLGTSAFVLYLGLDCSPEELGISAASNFIIDDRDEEVEVATPLTMMRYLNTQGGAIYGFQHNTQDEHITCN